MAGRFISSRMRWCTSAALLLVAIWIQLPIWPGVALAQEQAQSAERKPIALDRAPARVISDPNPVFRAMAIDPGKGEVFIANDKESAGASILVYPTQFPPTDRIMEPRRRIAGPDTDLGMVCGVALSLQHGELYSISGESGTLNVYKLDANGNVEPLRRLNGVTPRASAGVFLDAKNDEVYITTQHVNRVSAFRREFGEDDEALRYIQGPKTGLADPHGIYVDSDVNEIYVTNHGHWRETVPGEGERRGPESLTRTSLGYTEPGRVLPLGPSTGKFLLASVSVYSRTANGDAAPLRVIQGLQTQLNQPDGVTLDPVSGQIVVANTGGDSILFFDRNASGNVAPVRVLKGAATKIKGPVGVSIDFSTNELWVASWDNHIAGVFPRMANGNVAPLRIIRSASDSAPLASMGRIGAVAYDPKRQEILAPN